MSVIPSTAFARKAILRSLGDLPPLPAVANKVLAESEKPDASPSKLEAILQADPAIAAKALRVVNSAYYGLPGNVSSLNQACVLLGVMQIRNIVLGMSAVSAISKTQFDKGGLSKFWLHSFATAHATHLIGVNKKIRALDLDVLFVGGLLHDIGKLFLFANFPEFYNEVLTSWAEDRRPLYLVEREILGVTHDQIGGEICRIWNLPNALCGLIESHEGPFTLESEVLCFPLHIGDEITKYLYERDEYPYSPLIDPVAAEWLNFESGQMKQLIDEVQHKVESMKGVVSQLAA